MIQIFIIGSSSVYGVGGENGGWADMVKRAFHKKMFSRGGVGEKYEVFNFGKSGATIDFAEKIFSNMLELYGRGGKLITVVCVGGNNAKAEDRPDNFVSTLEEYTEEMSDFFDTLKKRSATVIAVGGGYYDESKTNPKDNPLTGGKSYLTNKRKQEFERQQELMCGKKQIPFIKVNVSEEEWKREYLSSDGVHPNDKGHTLIAGKVMAEIELLL